MKQVCIIFELSGIWLELFCSPSIALAINVF
jgi:hypothetical protein